MNVPLRTTGYKPAQRRCFWLVPLAFMAALSLLWSNPAYPAEPGSSDELQVEITKKGLGKEAVLRKGAREWYMMIEVTPENTVVVRQEKENETYLVDESETHDRAMTSGEVDVAITDFVNSVKTQVKQR
ncbi:MAG: hypothetical protein ACT4OO_04745 [Nitrospiraceae bacterium]